MECIGDSAYLLMPQLMRPYRDNGHLTARQRHFNQQLNAARVVIEHAFGILKNSCCASMWLLMETGRFKTQAKSVGDLGASVAPRALLI
ncbi:hypothetical protein SKAU_G00032750 [Synaphobranchus kaupii]|uniref:DDE Tnp4 domain-containing protein n=1 Tax=Synaphobranchus kaupii TaxID=118154 RepID=A0A9Q1JG48_SYNKA|nr:hypothetical protein SKAU_G00032750 [Synaphobranchus kaupii]